MTLRDVTSQVKCKRFPIHATDTRGVEAYLHSFSTSHYIIVSGSDHRIPLEKFLSRTEQVAGWTQQLV